MSRIFKLYERALSRSPYLVQAIQTGVLMGAGDIISQKVIEKKSLQALDIKRTLKFSSIGFFVAGPVLHTWYGVLYKYVGSQGKAVAIKKVLIDQTLFAPSFLGTILVIIGGVQGKNWETIKTDLKHNYSDVLTTNYYVWPWVQIANFYYVPLQYQVLVVQGVALFWNTYFAWKINQKINVDTTVEHGLIKLGDK